MKYKGYEIKRTNKTTSFSVKFFNGHYKAQFRYLYEIEGMKEASKRPFLTTIEDCKKYIDVHL